MKCFKCRTEDDLTIKNTQRNGTKLMICRTCRRNEYQTKGKFYEKAAKVDENWAKLARENNKRIAQKWATQ